MERLRVLVTDDEPGMTAAVERVLKDYCVSLSGVTGEVGFEVDTALTGEEALEIMEQRSPDILLLDYKLPGISGLDVLDRVTAGEAETLTVMITAYATLETAVSATKRGAWDFLAKPFTPDELKSTIRKAAGSVILSRQARRLAAEKRMVRFQFISVLAHELKAPLAAIEGYLHIVNDRVSGDDLAAYDHVFERCMIRTRHMRKLVMDLLDLTRIESGQKTRELTQTDIVEAARHAMETAEPEASQRNISINLEAPDSVLMRADRAEIGMIFNNLLSNAVKYNRDGGSVTVALAEEDDTVTIKVADTGIGMSKEEVDRLFDEFVRIRNERTRDILGSGLGLSIVKKLALLYGGRVHVESKPDAGSTFTVTLSKQPAPDPVQLADTAS